MGEIGLGLEDATRFGTVTGRSGLMTVAEMHGISQVPKKKRKTKIEKLLVQV